MHRLLGICTLASLLTLPIDPHLPSAASQDEELCEQLRFLGVFLGEWTGHFDDPDSPFVIHETWTAILNGQAIRRTRAVPAAERFEAEAVYFYDRQADSVRFILVTNNSYVNRGVVEHDGDVFRQTGEQIAPDSSIRSTMGTYRFRNEDTLVEEGGHTIIFERRRPG